MTKTHRVRKAIEATVDGQRCRCEYHRMRRGVQRIVQLSADVNGHTLQLFADTILLSAQRCSIRIAFIGVLKNHLNRIDLFSQIDGHRLAISR